MTRPRYRPWLRMPRAGRRVPPVRRGRGLLLSALLGVGLALLVIAALDSALRPVVTTLAQARTENVVTGIINDAVMETLSADAVAYQDLVTLERDSSGQVALLSTNSAKLNALRTRILQTVLEKVDSLTSEDLGIPLGSITGLSTASDWGPDLPVQVLAAATPTAEFRNVFTSAGINQTLHQIMLDVEVEITLLIPGGKTETRVDAAVCVAETLLMGQVPDTYLGLPAAGS
ncbi:sporulation protein YunB [Intestinimonas massiliensis (ex Afouda et al. 2020)]|uniref:sporulation protein YunB n=1 Tax=Intestinimonas massiliensis (ex Afouda et al. 2020) TaxID=1673721 RepID=UPI00103157AD|nr:sporulation protein YunB [Intestinimonas massiliensis (ex Afouda et al. 2020)]